MNQHYFKMERNYYKDILLGVAVGDALGVPVEFKSREYLNQNPITDMIGFGTHNQPIGTFSDDSSLTFCLAEAICDNENEFSKELVTSYFIEWYLNDFWCADELFDIGHQTRHALNCAIRGDEFICYETKNGNGSLMRILPLVMMMHNKNILERFELVKEISSITHSHIRSIIACFYYIEFANNIILGYSKEDAYKILKIQMPQILNTIGIDKEEIDIFSRLLADDIFLLSKDEIKSDGYVVNTLEACIWCLFNNDNYENTVLCAVNLGEDTDTTAAVVGGLAGLVYGHENIPSKWKKSLRRKIDILCLCNKLEEKHDKCFFK